MVPTIQICSTISLSGATKIILQLQEDSNRQCTQLNGSHQESMQQVTLTTIIVEILMLFSMEYHATTKSMFT